LPELMEEPEIPVPVDAFLPMERPPSLSERVAERLQDLILSGAVAPGERLPPERELAQRFGVSRTVIREAIRRLAGTGLVGGRSGGRIEVRDVGSSGVRDSMNRFLRRTAFLDPADLQQALAKLHEVRTMLELQIATVAARDRTDDDIEAMRRSADSLAAASLERERAEADVRFHRDIAVATHNELYVVLLDSIRDPLTDIRHATLRLSGPRPDAIAGHAAIIEAIVAGDGAAARSAMGRHLEESAKALGRLTPDHFEPAPRS
jgi:GntR family transcriptional repressor for pyruvate dehydrogenase complex